MIDNTLMPPLTVNEVIRRFPPSLTVFHEFGIDSCCGGHLLVADAARRHGIEPAEIFRALRECLVETVESAR